MSKDPSERKAYRKSPGRQYGYDYDPLHTQSGHSQSDSASRSGPLSTQRPDPRRTRQLLRKNILAGKRLAEIDGEEIDTVVEPEDIENPEQEIPYEEAMESNTPYSRRHSVRRNPIVRPYDSSNDGLEQTYAETEQDWQELDNELDYVEPDLRYEEPLDNHLSPANTPSNRPHRYSIRNATPAPEEEYEEDYDEGYDEPAYEEIERSPSPDRRKRRKGKVSRRGLLLGAGAVVVSGTAIAAYELGPRIPQAVNEVGTNIEHQLQDAFNKGITQGANDARREIITSLDNLEGFTLNGAISAAHLTRVAYDVFVSPIIHFGSSLTSDFLNGMLSALKTARGWLQGAYQDNASLEAIQKVLESWASQVTIMPKQLDAITQTDLDGAQGYLRALQGKLNEEQAKLNNPPPATSTNPTPPSTQKAK